MLASQPCSFSLSFLLLWCLSSPIVHCTFQLPRFSCWGIPCRLILERITCCLSIVFVQLFQVFVSRIALKQYFFFCYCSRTPFHLLKYFNYKRKGFIICLSCFTADEKLLVDVLDFLSSLIIITWCCYHAVWHRQCILSR